MFVDFVGDLGGEQAKGSRNRKVSFGPGVMSPPLKGRFLTCSLGSHIQMFTVSTPLEVK